jgi:PAS domain S-box-containing protein
VKTNGPYATEDAAPSLEEDDRLYALLVQSVVDYAIFVLDPHGYILTWNRGAERLKGYTRDQIVGSHFSVFYLEQDRSDGHPEYELAIAAQRGRFEEEGWRVRRDGTHFWANVVITALRRDGELVGYAKVTRDLSERKRAEEERERLVESERAARHEAEAANRAKGEFLATVSHELRTPLNAIAGYVQLLEMGIHGALAPRQEEALGRIRRNHEHLLVLINDLLQFTRIQAGHLEVRREAVPVARVLAEIEAMVVPPGTGHGPTFRCEPCEPGLEVVGDRERIEQVLLNLVSNAIKFTGAGGRTQVTAVRSGQSVHFRVRDTGPGIAPDKLEAIFEPFIQVRDLATGDSSRQGVGLGLAISRDLARAMGGELTVESTQGTGSVFTLTLPAGEAKALSASSA